MNLYGYCGAGPVRRSDPSGEVVPLLAVAAIIILTTVIAEAPTSQGDLTPEALAVHRSECSAHSLDAAGNLLALASLPGLANSVIKAAVGGLAKEGVAVAETLGGRLGNEGHRAAVRSAAIDIQNANKNWILRAGGGGAEEMVTSVRRYPDIWFVTPEGNNIFVQVGRSLMDGSPVAREIPAIGDLVRQGEVWWVPYK